MDDPEIDMNGDAENKIIEEQTADTNTNKVLNGNEVDVDILPKVGGNSIIIYVCSCFNWSYSVPDKQRKN